MLSASSGHECTEPLELRAGRNEKSTDGGASRLTNGPGSSKVNIAGKKREYLTALWGKSMERSVLQAVIGFEETRFVICFFLRFAGMPHDRTKSAKVG
jgi:hypothetical protein